MTWNDITLGQFQDLHKLSINTELDEIDRTAMAISILYNKTESEVDNMSMLDFNRLGRECAFLRNTIEIPGKPVKTFRVGLKKYAINYRVSELKHRQYVEILSFSEKPIENMHNIMASLVTPVKWGIRQSNKSNDHTLIAADMLNAPLLAVYHSAVFFCKLYRDSIKHIQDFLIKEMMSKGITKNQAQRLVTDSINAMDGFIQQSNLQD